ncbi:MAG TPA: hypothetical protein VLB44_11435 [Kofleriaceae bacterium]|nr:hypothetical protein [Kofleriaceae bacterium]
MRIAICAALLALPSLASARPITAGVGVGRIQAKADADTGDAYDTRQVFGRIGITSRVGAQLELGKITTGLSGTEMKTGTLLLVVELASSGRLMPMMFGGLGIDRISSPYGSDIHGSHKEGGFALEYRADGGFVIGGDVRLGGISIDPQYEIQPIATSGGAIALYAPTAESGEYRSARVYAAIRF